MSTVETFRGVRAGPDLPTKPTCPWGHARVPGGRGGCVECRRERDRKLSLNDRTIVPPPITPVPAPEPEFPRGEEPWRADYEYGLAIARRNRAARELAVEQARAERLARIAADEAKHA